MFNRPWLVNSWPLRALRVGITQSNRSDASADFRVVAHDFPFCRGKLGWLMENGIADADLPYIMEQGAAFQRLELVAV